MMPPILNVNNLSLLKTIHLLAYRTKGNHKALDRKAVDTEINAFVATPIKNLNKDFFKQ